MKQITIRAYPNVTLQDSDGETYQGLTYDAYISSEDHQTHHFLGAGHGGVEAFQQWCAKIANSQMDKEEDR